MTSRSASTIKSGLLRGSLKERAPKNRMRQTAIQERSDSEIEVSCFQRFGDWRAAEEFAIAITIRTAWSLESTHTNIHMMYMMIYMICTHAFSQVCIYMICIHAIIFLHNAKHPTSCVYMRTHDARPAEYASTSTDISMDLRICICMCIHDA